MHTVKYIINTAGHFGCLPTEVCEQKEGVLAEKELFKCHKTGRYVVVHRWTSAEDAGEGHVMVICEIEVYDYSKFILAKLQLKMR